MKKSFPTTCFLYFCFILSFSLFPSIQLRLNACAFTSEPSTGFETGVYNEFKITTSSGKGVIKLQGTLPIGVSFVSSKDGSAILSGIPTLPSEEFSIAYSLKFSIPSYRDCKDECFATNKNTYLECTQANCGSDGEKGCTQDFILIITNLPCRFTTPNSKIFRESSGNFLVAVARPYIGSITIQMKEGSSLPDSVSFVDHGDGTGTLSAENVKPSEEGCYYFTFLFSSSNSEGDSCNSFQKFKLQLGSESCPLQSVKNLTVTQVQSTNATLGEKTPLQDISFDNIIRWEAPKTDSRIVAYKIFADKKLDHMLVEIPSFDKLRFKIRQSNVNPCKKHRYFVVAVDEFGNTSKPVKGIRKVIKKSCLNRHPR